MDRFRNFSNFLRSGIPFSVIALVMTTWNFPIFFNFDPIKSLNTVVLRLARCTESDEVRQSTHDERLMMSARIMGCHQEGSPMFRTN